MSIVIESNVPLVRIHGGISATLRKMSVGDSFVVLAGMSEASLRRLANYTGIKISIRTDANGQRRCWRTA